ncbi:MAG: hypothetical protein EGP68_07010 [Lachnospiraceae bacterium]|nr:hypothetical protein [Lachnospiraceae bacterium]MBD9124494.1 hypothetical protein [Lachnospiraceae bacterium]
MSLPPGSNSAVRRTSCEANACRTRSRSVKTKQGTTHENTPFFRRVLSIQAQCCEAASGLHSFAKIGRPSQNAGA